MEILLVLGFLLATLVTLVLCAWAVMAREGGARNRPATTTSAGWRALEARLHVDFIDGPRPCFCGMVDGFGVSIEMEVVKHGESRGTWTRIEVHGNGLIPGDVTLGPRRCPWDGSFGLAPPEGFELDVLADGPEYYLSAMLQPEVRSAAHSFVVGASGELRRGVLTGRWRGGFGDMNLEDELAALVRLAKSLAVPSIPAALLRIVRHDPNPRFRARSLCVLSQEHRCRSPEALEAFTHALADPEPGVRLLAADRQVPSAEAREVLASLACASSVRGELRAAAFERLVRHFPYASFAGVLPGLLLGGNPVAQRAAVVAAGRARDENLLGDLYALSGTRDEALGAALASALGAIGGAKAEGGLINLLAHPSTSVKAAAAAGLGAVGSIRAVQLLLPLTEGLLASGALKCAARGAVQAIQARHGEVAPGGLSLAESDASAGSLSLAA